MKKVYLLGALLLFLQCSFAQSGSIKLTVFSAGYNFPLGVENCGDNRLFIVQKGGQIGISDSTGAHVTRPFLDISDRVDASHDETGLLGLAFSPRYALNGLFYVYYTNKAGNSQISQFKVSKTDPNVANPGSEKLVLTIPQTYPNHVGGCIRFGPNNLLYIGIGDGNASGPGDPLNYAQNPSMLQGKMLRIKVNNNGTYSIPPSNPFINTPGYKKEIWATGLRNPWRFSFDAVNGALYIADVGEALWEEVDVQTKKSTGGENYGWRCYEGNHEFNTSSCGPQSGYTFPKYEYTHSSTTNDCAITGGFMYRGKMYTDLYGKYFFTDFCSGIIRSLTFASGKATPHEELRSGMAYQLTSFGEDYRHELYVVSSGGGTIYRISSAASITAPSQPSAGAVSMTVFPNPASHQFSVKYTTRKAEACVVTVYNANGRAVFTGNQTSVAGDNIWKIDLPSYVNGNCYVMVATLSGTVIRQNIAVK